MSDDDAEALEVLNVAVSNNRHRYGPPLAASAASALAGETEAARRNRRPKRGPRSRLLRPVIRPTLQTAPKIEQKTPPKIEQTTPPSQSQLSQDSTSCDSKRKSWAKAVGGALNRSHAETDVAKQRESVQAGSDSGSGDGDTRGGVRRDDSSSPVSRAVDSPVSRAVDSPVVVGVQESDAEKSDDAHVGGGCKDELALMAAELRSERGKLVRMAAEFDDRERQRESELADFSFKCDDLEKRGLQMEQQREMAINQAAEYSNQLEASVVQAAEYNNQMEAFRSEMHALRDEKAELIRQFNDDMRQQVYHAGQLRELTQRLQNDCQQMNSTIHSLKDALHQSEQNLERVRSERNHLRYQLSSPPPPPPPPPPPQQQQQQQPPSALPQTDPTTLQPSLVLQQSMATAQGPAQPLASGIGWIGGIGVLPIIPSHTSFRTPYSIRFQKPGPRVYASPNPNVGFPPKPARQATEYGPHGAHMYHAAPNPNVGFPPKPTRQLALAVEYESPAAFESSQSSRVSASQAHVSSDQMSASNRLNPNSAEFVPIASAAAS